MAELKRKNATRRKSDQKSNELQVSSYLSSSILKEDSKIFDLERDKFYDLDQSKISQKIPIENKNMSNSKSQTTKKNFSNGLEQNFNNLNFNNDKEFQKFITKNPMPIPASDLQNHLKGHNLLIKFLQNRTQEEEGYNCISKICLKIIKNWLGERIHYACLNESKENIVIATVYRNPARWYNSYPRYLVSLTDPILGGKITQQNNSTGSNQNSNRPKISNSKEDTEIATTTNNHHRSSQMLDLEQDDRIYQKDQKYATLNAIKDRKDRLADNEFTIIDQATCKPNCDQNFGNFPTFTLFLVIVNLVIYFVKFFYVRDDSTDFIDRFPYRFDSTKSKIYLKDVLNFSPHEIKENLAKTTNIFEANFLPKLCNNLKVIFPNLLRYFSYIFVNLNDSLITTSTAVAAVLISGINFEWMYGSQRMLVFTVLLVLGTSLLSVVLSIYKNLPFVQLADIQLSGLFSLNLGLMIFHLTDFLLNWECYSRITRKENQRFRSKTIVSVRKFSIIVSFLLMTFSQYWDQRLTINRENIAQINLQIETKTSELSQQGQENIETSNILDILLRIPERSLVHVVGAIFTGLLLSPCLIKVNDEKPGKKLWTIISNLLYLFFYISIFGFNFVYLLGKN